MLLPMNIIRHHGSVSHRVEGNIQPVRPNCLVQIESSSKQKIENTEFTNPTKWNTNQLTAKLYRTDNITQNFMDFTKANYKE